jgi:hypothetical protein
MAIWTKANRKMLGAVLITFHTFPLAPTTAKNTCLSERKLKACCFLLDTKKNYFHS